MIHDPRSPDPNHMTRIESTHPFHQKLRKTLNLLCIRRAIRAESVYFVVEGLSEWPATLEEVNYRAKYFYETHSCPTNFVQVALIAVDGDADPHGIFEFVDSVWMMDEYGSGNRKEYLIEVFPQIKGGERYVPDVDAAS